MQFYEVVINRLLCLSRPKKRILQVVADFALLSISFAAAMALRYDSFGAILTPGAWLAFAMAAPLSLFVFAKLGLYRAIVRFISERAMISVLAGVAASALMLLIISQSFALPVPRSVPVIYALLSIAAVGATRIAMRRLLNGRFLKPKSRVLIYGAGSSGRQLAQTLRSSEDYAVLGFIDDAPDKQETTIGGRPVFARSELARLVHHEAVDLILLAIPSASHSERSNILADLEHLPVLIKTIPEIDELLSDTAKIEELRDVSIEDLLGRDPVPAHPGLMSANVTDRVVCVTGAGGSIGSELCRQILRLNPRHLVLFDVSEFALYAIEQELKSMCQIGGHNTVLTPVIGSVQNRALITSVLRSAKVNTVYHAAAYKHVPMVEYNVSEGIRNNVFGTRHTAEAAVQAGVSSFILVSTDKAVRPTNVMGASKRLAELICQAMAEQHPQTTFSMVRFGNVLGSSGSVIPLFRKQIDAGGPVTVTHPEITRYFMTIPEAAQLVIQAGAMARGGDVFVLDMGTPVKIVDLAKRLIRLSGLKPVPVDQTRSAAADEIAIEFTALRPGEKLYEELLISENATRTPHAKIMTASEIKQPFERVMSHLRALESACAEHDYGRIRDILKGAGLGYAPGSEIVDFFAHNTKRPSAPKQPQPLTKTGSDA